MQPPTPLSARVPSDIWHLVMPYLHNPIPWPRSSPARSALRQPDLCNCARVCQLFSSIVDTILYKEIITDDIPSLFRYVKLPSTRRRFALTRKLFFEYGAKGQDTSYRTLLQSGGSEWRRMGRLAKELEEVIMKEAAEELVSIGASLILMLAIDDASSKLVVFPHVESVAIGTFFGATDDVWRRLNREASPEGLEKFELVAEAFGVFLAQLPLARHLCMGNPDGPLNLGINPANLISACTRTYHINERCIPLIETRPRARLVSEPLSTAEDFWVLRRSLEFTLLNFAKYRTKRDVPDKYDIQPIDLEIYCSVALSPPVTGGHPGLGEDEGEHPALEAQRKELEELGRRFQNEHRELSGLQDVIRWFPSGDAHRCGACGAGPPA